MTIKQAIQNVINECPNEYAKSYAAAMGRAYREHGQHGVYVQVLYVLSNIVDVDPEYDEVWTGETAEETIKTLKNYKEGDWN
jgi:hypothetical protein